MALEVYERTKWTTTRIVPTHLAPFAGLDATPSESGAFAGASQGVALMLLGLGTLAVINGVRQGSRGDLGDDFVVNVYPSERRTDTGWGSARYRKSKEYRVHNMDKGITQSFHTKAEARRYIKYRGGDPKRAGL
jgi:hypothetical protein